MSRTGSSTHGLAFKLSCRYALMAPAFFAPRQSCGRTGTAPSSGTQRGDSMAPPRKRKKQSRPSRSTATLTAVIIAAASLGCGSYAFAVRRETRPPARAGAQGGCIAGGSLAASHAHDTPLCREANAFRSDGMPAQVQTRLLLHTRALNVSKAAAIRARSAAAAAASTALSATDSAVPGSRGPGAQRPRRRPAVMRSPALGGDALGTQNS